MLPSRAFMVVAVGGGGGGDMGSQQPLSGRGGGGRRRCGEGGVGGHETFLHFFYVGWWYTAVATKAGRCWPGTATAGAAGCEKTAAGGGSAGEGGRRGNRREERRPPVWSGGRSKVVRRISRVFFRAEACRTAAGTCREGASDCYPWTRLAPSGVIGQ